MVRNIPRHILLVKGRLVSAAGLFQLICEITYQIEMGTMQARNIITIFFYLVLISRTARSLCVVREIRSRQLRGYTFGILAVLDL
jgi:hypothetical protein